MPVLRADSIVTHPPAGLPDRERVWLEAVGLSFAIEDLVFERLRELLAHVAETNSLPLGEATIPTALSDAWSFVDSSHRLGDLLGRGMGQFKTAELSRLAREFQGVSKGAFDLRDSVQHIADETRNLEQCGVPVWGALSWAVVMQTDPPLIRSCGLFAGGGGTTVTNRLVNPLGMTFRHRVDHINLEAFELRVSLSDVHASASAFARELESSLSTTFAGAPRQFPGGVVVMDIGAASEPTTNATPTGG